MVTELFKIKTEIQVLNYVLNEGNYNLLPSQKTYLSEKLEDLIHSYLLVEERKGTISVTHNRNLFNGDFSIGSNINILKP